MKHCANLYLSLHVVHVYYSFNYYVIERFVYWVRSNEKRSDERRIVSC